MKRITIALVGDFDEKIYTLVALNRSIEHCARDLSFEVEAKWVPTENIENMFLGPLKFNGIWIVPGSPYKNDVGVYEVIRKAREENIPIIGSCGGFQYMIIEYAKNVLNIEAAGHAESEPDAIPVVSKLSCSLIGQEELVSITDKSSWLYNVLREETVVGKYYCSYGINPAFQESLNKLPLVFTAFSPTGEVRAFELKTHRFFKGTLFQPALDSSEEKPNPLIKSFFEACR
jgi:CTP synthase (UTP-ammonia lyase)